MYYTVAEPDQSGFRNLIQVFPRPDGRSKARYMQTKQMACGKTSYHWNPPSWARRAGFPFHGQALGSDFIAALIHSDRLNRFLDDWRTSEKDKRYKVRSDKSVYQSRVQKG